MDGEFGVRSGNEHPHDALVNLDRRPFPIGAGPEFRAADGANGARGLDQESFLSFQWNDFGENFSFGQVGLGLVSLKSGELDSGVGADVQFMALVQGEIDMRALFRTYRGTLRKAVPDVDGVPIRGIRELPF